MKTKITHSIRVIVSLSLFVFFALAPLLSCSPQKKEHENYQTLNEEGLPVSEVDWNAIGPFMTVDNKGNLVLCWTEELPDDHGYIIRFSRFDEDRGTFGDAFTVTPSKGTSGHPENMNKLAFTSDGTLVAVYTRKHPTEENRFAGSILYTQSFDDGQTWSEERYIHSDTSHNVGRGYFDLATLPDGEVGAIWLDGRFRDMKGSAIFFAKTEGKKGFGIDKVIGESTCECCRTDLFVDEASNIHMVYRDIIDERIRDVVHRLSTDNGETFSVARTISRDNWEIDGCPHTGPSLATSPHGLYAAWFTAGGTPGVYLTRTQDLGGTFRTRQMVSEKARHPQIAGTSDGRLIMVWDEMEKPGATVAHGGHSREVQHGVSLGSKIVLQIRDEDAVVESLTLTNPGADASFPVLHLLSEREVLVAWTQEENGRSRIFYKVVMIGELL